MRESSWRQEQISEVRICPSLAGNLFQIGPFQHPPSHPPPPPVAPSRSRGRAELLRVRVIHHPATAVERIRPTRPKKEIIKSLALSPWAYFAGFRVCSDSQAPHCSPATLRSAEARARKRGGSPCVSTSTARVAQRKTANGRKRGTNPW